MSLVLTLVQSPHPQPVRQMRLDDGELVIGRAAEADWRIDDPDMYVSRAHCTITGSGGSFTVTDTSSGGLYLDDTGRPLGAGNAAPLRHGMRLRLGDYVVEVELGGAAGAATARPGTAPPARRDPSFDADDFFSTPTREEPKPQRPPDLPDPFERPHARTAREEPAERAAPPAFDDPFTLDPPRSGNGDRGTDRDAPPPEDGTLGFDWDAPEPPPEPRSRQRERPPPDFDWGGTAPGPGREAEPEHPPEPPAQPEPEPPAPPRRAPSTGDDAAFEAFVRGLGLEPGDVPAGDPAARMEAFGREYRLMAEGLMHLLRKRAEEKSGARIAQTVVGSAEVNPLKFMPTVEDALAAMIAERRAGFSDAEDAIIGAVRDLAQHHVSAWRGIQAALRRMVDRFDPETLEKEVEELGLLETLLAGGRRAKLWELYEKRYREIARNAETRFLGEVGADFRDAYETEE